MARTILVVDDEEAIREVIGEIFSTRGYEIVTASNGREALEVLRDPQRRPGLILLDLMMPVMSGFEFLEQVRDDTTITPPPIVIMSAYLGEKKLPENCVVPPRARIQKPFTVASLLAIVEENYRNDAA
jgi:CheY-like chemotaxis protein